MQPESSVDLLAAARHAGFAPDADLPGRIDRAIGSADERGELGRLYVAKAVALQGRGDASASASASCNAVPHLLAAGDTSTAALASTMAAVFLDQCQDMARAIEYAVDAIVMLEDINLDDFESVRASLALSGFYTRLSSFETAVDLGRRAFAGAQQIEGVPIDPVAYTFGYVSVEAAHVNQDPLRRDTYLADAIDAERWLRQHGATAVSTDMLAGGLHAEIAAVRGTAVAQDALDAAAALYADAAPDLVAWHRLVRASNARHHGNEQAALDLLDAAIPGLEASADNHCLVRAINERSSARAALGDLAGAFTDAQHLARTVRGWQVSQVGWLAAQVTRRAELERTASALRAEAEQLTADLDHDVTTGCRSRRWLENYLVGLETSEEFGQVLMFDIDRFKTVNDTYGHSVGDEVLARFGALVAAATLHDDEVARFGGEEFMVVTFNSAANGGVRGGESLAEQIRLDVAAHDWESIAPGIELTTSVGVAGGRLSEVRQLLISADEALLEAKRLGRNRTVMSPSFADDLDIFV